MRIIQISDTHLSPGKAHFADNWPPLARWIAEQRPDLVIHTGDVTVDGADVDEVDERVDGTVLLFFGAQPAMSNTAIAHSATPAVAARRRDERIWLIPLRD